MRRERVLFQLFKSNQKKNEKKFNFNHAGTSMSNKRKKTKRNQKKTTKKKKILKFLKLKRKVSILSSSIPTMLTSLPYDSYYLFFFCFPASCSSSLHSAYIYAYLTFIYIYKTNIYDTA